MKLIIVIAAVVGISILGSYFLINKPDVLGVAVYVNADPTDSLVAHPDSAIFSYTGLEKDQWQSAKIMSTSITEYEFNPVYISYLPAREILFSNPINRKQEINTFYQQTLTNFSFINNEVTPRKQSSIYKNIARQLNDLSHIHAKKKLDFIYSNIEENTSLFSIYKKADHALLKSNDDSIKAFFIGMEPLENLDGITIYFVYQPQSLEDENRFLLMSSLFKDIFTQAGAHVYILAKLSSGAAEIDN